MGNPFNNRGMSGRLQITYSVAHAHRNQVIPLAKQVQGGALNSLQILAQINRLAHQALDKGRTLGIDTSYHWSRRDPPPFHNFTKTD